MNDKSSLPVPASNLDRGKRPVAPLAGLAILLLLNLLVNSVAYAYDERDEQWQLFSGMAIGLACGQMALAAVYLVFSRQRLFVRTGIVLMGAIGSGVLADISGELSNLWQLESRLMLGLALIVSLPLLLLWRLGLRLRWRLEATLERGRGWQFTLGEMLSGMTSAAMLMAFVRCTMVETRIPLSLLLDLPAVLFAVVITSVIGTIVAIPGWISIFSILGQDHLRDGLGVGGLLITFCIFVIRVITLGGPGGPDMASVYWSLLFYTLVVASGCTALHANEYRFRLPQQTATVELLPKATTPS